MIAAKFLYAGLLCLPLPVVAQSFLYKISVSAITSGAVPVNAFSIQFSAANFLLPPQATPVHLLSQPGFTVTGSPKTGYGFSDAVLSNPGGPYLSFSLTFASAAGSPLVISLLPAPLSLFNTTGTYSLQSFPTLGLPETSPPPIAGNSGAATLSITPLATAAPPPFAASISNSASYAPGAAPNGGIAQGSLFVIFGYYMGPAALAQSDYPLSANLAGTSIRATIGSVSTDALLVYTSFGQVAAILPSRTPVGSGFVTVSYNGQTGPPLPLTVAASSFGTYTVSSNGLGPGIITGADYRLKTSAAPAKPGETVILWGTGLGAISGDESNRPAPENRFTPEVFVGNQAAKVSYAGRSSCCAALDQVNFTIPAGIEGCYVPVTLRNGAVAGNFTSVPISSSAGTCMDTVGFSPDLLARATTGGDIKAGMIAIGPVPIFQFFGFPLDQAVALSLSRKMGVTIAPQDVHRVFHAPPAESRAVVAEMLKKYGIHSLAQVRRLQSGIRALVSGSQGAAVIFADMKNLAATVPQFASDFPPPGTCTIFQNSPTTAPGAGVLTQPLDAGSQLSLTGPAGTSTLTKVASGKFGKYEALLGPGSAPEQVPLGSYRISGGGGKDVGVFSASLNLSSSLQWQNKSSITVLDRTQPLTVTWSGGPLPGHVIFGGFADVAAAAIFVCVEDSRKGTFTVPPYVLSALPAVRASRGYLFLMSHPFESTFQAPGLDAGFFANFSNDSRQVEFR